MNKKGEVTLGMIFSIFIAIIFGFAFISQIAATQDLATEKQAITNESIDISSVRYAANKSINQSKQLSIATANIPDGWKINKCPISGFVLRNQSGQALTADTDYYFYSTTGLFNLSGSSEFLATDTVNNTGIDYSFCDDGYNTSASSRGVARLWTIFCALIILSAATYGIKEWLNQ